MKKFRPKDCPILMADEPILLNKGLACLIGDREALVVQQLLYWIKRYEDDESHFHEGRTWVYNTLKKTNGRAGSWEDNFPFWSVSTIRRLLKSLEGKGIVRTGCFNKMHADRTKWYTLDFDVLNELSRPCVQNEQMEEPRENHMSKMNTPCVQNEHIKVSKVSTAIPETTSEITSEITGPSVLREENRIKPKSENSLRETGNSDLTFDRPALLKSFLSKFVQGEPPIIDPEIVFNQLIKEQLVWHKGRCGRGDITKKLYRYICKRYAVDLEFSDFDAQYCSLSHHLGIIELRPADPSSRKHLSNALAAAAAVLAEEDLTFKDYARYIKHLFESNKISSLTMQVALNLRTVSSFTTKWSHGKLPKDAFKAVM